MVTIRLLRNGSGNVARMHKPREVIGSGREGVDWTVDDPEVSVRHAALWIGADGGLWIEDLGSVSGTRVGGEPLLAPRRLGESEPVQIGPATLTVTGLLPDGRVPAGSLFALPPSGAEERRLEEKRNTSIEGLDPDIAQTLAYAWCHRVTRVHAASALESASFLDAASAIRGTTTISDRATSIDAHAKLKALSAATQRELQERHDAGHSREELEAAELALQALRHACEAVRASVAPYSGSPGFAVMIGFGENTEPPLDDTAARAAHARPRTGVVAGHVVDVARILDPEGGLAEVRLQVKELLDASRKR